MAGASSIAPENAPGCQVDHTPEWQHRHNNLCYHFSGDSAEMDIRHF
ncbi:hypothetical protein MM689_000598 [Escherichia coli]|nr:hypothetical protein [Escherichia coli]